VRMSSPDSSGCVANERRSVCGVAGLGQAGVAHGLLERALQCLLVEMMPAGGAAELGLGPS
jgi:hypothetical protein